MPITQVAQEKATELKIFPERLDLLEKKLNQWIDEGRRQAMVVCVSRYNEIIFQGAYGKSAPEPTAQPTAMNHIFCVASVTKPVIAALMLQLQEDGEIDFCDSVSKYVPHFESDDKKDIAIWHLLTHTSGFDHEDLEKSIKEYIRTELGLTLPADEKDDEQWDVVLLEARKKLGLPDMESVGAAAHDTWMHIESLMPPSSPPHKKMSYYNTGYQICSDILVQVCGKPIEEIAQERLFKPLGMVDSHFILPKEKWSRVARHGETCEGFPYQDSEHCFVSESGAGGLKTTAHDMIRFCRMVASNGMFEGKRILSPISILSMSTDYNYDLESYESWSTGFNIKAKKFDTEGFLRPPASLNHSGWGGAIIYTDPQTGLCATLLSIKYPDSQVYPLFSNILYSALAEL